MQDSLRLTSFRLCLLLTLLLMFWYQSKGTHRAVVQVLPLLRLSPATPAKSFAASNDQGFRKFSWWQLPPECNAACLTSGMIWTYPDSVAQANTPPPPNPHPFLQRSACKILHMLIMESTALSYAENVHCDFLFG